MTSREQARSTGLVRRAALLLIVAATLTAACARDAGVFVTENARAHVGMLAGTIGSRPIGTPANAKAREYVVDQLKQFGFEVRVQEIDARRHELGKTARVANVIALLPGERPEAIGLVSHYDSSPDAPGATDDGLGVGVSLEAARLFAARPARRWSLLVLITDGEESGLMGAAGLITDRAVMERLSAYVNFESIGSSGSAVLFETGPGNAWLVAPWARTAPHPRGGSYALEIYQRLPNDTDFSILKTTGVPGLNFAPVGDSYAYHTARDTPDRLSPATIRTTGENVMGILTALQEVDITQRFPQNATFFDVGGAAAVSYGPLVHAAVSALALLFGVIAWVRLSGDAIRQNGVLRWLLTIAWVAAGAAAVVAGMIAMAWLVRAAREVYHPWYARPGRLFVLLILGGATAGWSIARLGQWLPRRAHPSRHPALTWSVALPAWIALAAMALWFAPSAAYLWVWPLFAAGLLMTVLPPRHDGVIRVASLAVLAVAGTLWLRETRDLLPFVVAVMGRLPIVTPAAVYPAILAAAGTMIVPPLVAALASGRQLTRPVVITSLLLLATAGAAAAVYVAPAYTAEQPLRRVVRVLQDGDAASSIWEVGSTEPGLDLAPGAPAGWSPGNARVGAHVPWGRLVHPFVFTTSSAPLGPAPASVGGFEVKPLADGQQVRLTIVPREPGLTVAIVLPPGISPVRSSLPGRRAQGHWTATYIAPPAEGIAWEASFRGTTAELLQQIRVGVVSSRLPGGSGWQGLPGWLPQERTVWSASATWVLPAASGLGIAPVPSLR
jgi:hypothetical protein